MPGRSKAVIEDDHSHEERERVEPTPKRRLKSEPARLRLSPGARSRLRG
jgi:hypothetical protein